MSDEEESGCDCPPGLPPWMGTFADLMSLLMCFFVLLLSFSEMDALKFKRLAGSMAQAFGVQNKLKVNDVPKGTSIIAQEFSPGTPQPTPINEIWQHTEDISVMSLETQCSESFDVEQGDPGVDSGVQSRIKKRLEEMIEQTERDAVSLANTLHDQIISGEIEIETRGTQLIIRIREKESFRSGSSELNGSYRDIMREIQEVLIDRLGKIQVQGHTDDIPISTARFRSNWELSSSRAVSVAHELMRDDLISPWRFEVAGFAETVPLAPNDTEENRSRNRRVEIVIRQGLQEALDPEDLKLIRDSDKDILKDLDLDPEYLFDLNSGEVF